MDGGYWYNIYFVDENSYYVHCYKKTLHAPDGASDFYVGKVGKLWQYTPVPMLNKNYDHLKPYPKYKEAYVGEWLMKDIVDAIEKYEFEQRYNSWNGAQSTDSTSE